MRSLLYLPLFACLVACKARVRDADYFPMGIGDKHTYQIIKQVPGEPYRRLITLRTEVLEKAKRNGNDYVRVRSNFTWGSYTMGGESFQVVSTLFRTDQRGVYGIIEQNPDIREQQIVKFPLKIGASWDVQMGRQTNKFSVVGFEDVALERSIYRNCIHLHSESSDGVVLDNWKAPGIGDVKSEMTSTTGAKESSSLIQFKPGK